MTEKRTAAAREVLRLQFPVDSLTPKQRQRAVQLGDRMEKLFVHMLASGANPDRLMTVIESRLPA